MATGLLPNPSEIFMKGMFSDHSVGRVGGVATRGRRQTVVMETVVDEDWRILIYTCRIFVFFSLVQVI